MQKTPEFDSFFFIIGDIFYKEKKYSEAIIAYQSYLEKFPSYYKVLKKLVKAAAKGKDQKVIDEADKMITILKGD